MGSGFWLGYGFSLFVMRSTPGAHANVTLIMYESCMSYNLKLHCGCTVYVACNPHTNLAHTRIIERRGALCRIRGHEVGTRLFLWDMLPERQDPAAGQTVETDRDSQG